MLLFLILFAFVGLNSGSDSKNAGIEKKNLDLKPKRISTALAGWEKLKKYVEDHPELKKSDFVGEYVPKNAFKLEENEPSQDYPKATFYVGDVTEVAEIVRDIHNKPPMVVVFGSPVSLGGFPERASAQEEHIARCSNMVQSVANHELGPKLYPMKVIKYDTERAAVLATNVVFVRFHEDEDFFKPKNYLRFHAYIDFASDLRKGEEFAKYSAGKGLTVKGIHTRKFCELSVPYVELLKEKMIRQFQAAQEYDAPLITGAFGCGEFQNHPDKIAKLYREISRYFPTVPLYFAIIEEALCDYFIESFTDSSPESVGIAPSIKMVGPSHSDVFKASDDLKEVKFTEMVEAISAKYDYGFENAM